MVNSIFGIKKNMTSTYDARGRRVGATVVEVQPNVVTQVNATSVQLGFGTSKSLRKPQLGHLKKANVDGQVRWMRETKVEETNVNPGQEIKAWDFLNRGDAVKVTGTSKGKGFQGGVRRHGFHGGPKTHGQSDRHRAPGSIGQTTTPGRVYKGKKMAGHMGLETVTTRNLEVVAIDRKTNLVTIKGAVPGVMGGVVEITRLGRIKGYTPPPEEKEDEEEEATEGAEKAADAAEQPAEMTEPEHQADAEAPQDATAVAANATKEGVEGEGEQNA